MEIENHPPVVGKADLLDKQFADWWLFLNTWGTAAFLLFLACLGTGDHKHTSALLSSALLGWGYWAARHRFPTFISRLREDRSKDSKRLENEIFRDHFWKKLFAYFPFLLGFTSLSSLLIWPALVGNYRAYIQFWPGLYLARAA